MKMTTEKRGLVEEIHRPARKIYPRRSTILNGLSDLYQADLVEMIPYARENNGYKYILTCINCFSKRAFAAPLKNKTSAEVAQKMKDYILDKVSSGATPKHMQTDQGVEFYGGPFKKLMKKYAINHYSTYSVIKAAIIERFNRTLKSKMWVEFNVQGSYRWVDILQSLVDKYNKTYHRSIKMRPIDVNHKNETEISLRLNRHKVLSTSTAKFKIGQLVRISKQKNVFGKGYKANWTYEVFKITKVGKTAPRVYYLQDLKGNDIKGCFYEQELLKAIYHDIYLIEKIIKRKGDKVLVKYLGFDNTDNEWLPASSII